MRVIIKHPEHDPYVADIPNTLDALQGQVGGYIEIIVVEPDLVIICNEEGRIKRLPYNCELYGEHFFGTVIIVGTDGDDLTDVPDWAVERYA